MDVGHVYKKYDGVYWMVTNVEFIPPAGIYTTGKPLGEYVRGIDARELRSYVEGHLRQQCPRVEDGMAVADMQIGQVFRQDGTHMVVVNDIQDTAGLRGKAVPLAEYMASLSDETRYRMAVQYLIAESAGDAPDGIYEERVKPANPA